MAYKFQRGPATASGSFKAEEGLISSTTISGSSTLQVGSSATIANGLTVTAGGATVSAGGAAVTGTLGVFGAVSSSVGISSSVGQFGALTANTLSASSTLQVGSSATIANGLTVTAGGLTVSAGTSAFQAATATSLTATTGSFTRVSGGVVDLLTDGIIPNWDDANGKFSNSAITSNAGGVTTLSNGLTVTAGGATVTAGGLTVTAGGATVTAGGLTVTAGGAAVNGGNLTVSNGSISASSTLQVGGDTTLQKLTVNGDLIVLGDTFSASVGTLLIQDAAIVIGDGSGPSFQTGYGINFGSGSNQWATLLTAQADINGGAPDENVLSSSLSIKAPAFAGTFYGTIATSVQLVSDGLTLNNGVNYFADLSVNATVTLPASPVVGDTIQVKCKNLTGSPQAEVRINRAGTQFIDGEEFIILESAYAAVTLTYVGLNDWRVF